MELFLMALCVSLFGIAVSALAFGAAERGGPKRSEPEPRKLSVPAPQFFLDSAAENAFKTRVPAEVLLHRLEEHIRLEQAAAESFLSAPTSESLHTPTASPFLN